MSRRRALTIAGAAAAALLATWPTRPRAELPTPPSASAGSSTAPAIAGANAQPLTGIATDPTGARVILMPTTGPCTGHARQALHITPAGHRTTGCWIRTISTIHIAYLDGESGAIPAAEVTWATGI